MSSMTIRRPVVRRAADRSTRRSDTLAVEEPLEIRVNGEPFTSACGVCGTESVAAVRDRCPTDLTADSGRFPADVLAGLPDRLRAAQRVFDRTGGLHAAGLFTADGELLVAREDVGRHNAVDKVVGGSVKLTALTRFL